MLFISNVFIQNALRWTAVEISVLHREYMHGSLITRRTQVGRVKAEVHAEISNKTFDVVYALNYNLYDKKSFLINLNLMTKASTT